MRPENLSSSDSDEYIELSDDTLHCYDRGDRIVEPALQNVDHIFVCSAGSVASGSLYHTFHHRFSRVEHVHQVKTIAEQVEMCTTKDDYTLFLMGVRDPIVRNLSFFMQRCDQKEKRVFYDNGRCDRDGYVGTQEYVNSLSGEELATIFKERNFDMSSIEWFRMAACVFNIRANEKFEWERGFTLFKRPKYALIIYRLESIDLLEQYLRENLCVDDENKRIDTVMKINTWDKKWYRTQYDALMKSVRFTEEEVNGIYDTDVIRYLYSPEEIQSMKDRWLSLNVPLEEIEESAHLVESEESVPPEEVVVEIDTLEEVQPIEPIESIEENPTLEDRVEEEEVSLKNETVRCTLEEKVVKKKTPAKKRAPVKRRGKK